MRNKSTPAQKAANERRQRMEDFINEVGAEEAIRAFAGALRTRSSSEPTEARSLRNPAIRLKWARAADAVENTVNLVPSQAKKTMTFAELQRLTVANSSRCPALIDAGGTRKQYVGIGWIGVGAADGTESVRIVP